jgi:hypothetical protein
LKNIPKCCPLIFFPENYVLWKREAQKFGLLLKFSKGLAKVYDDLIGENLPNQVTLDIPN